MQLHTMKPRPGARHRVKRLGCGESSGHGKTSGKGHKGQKARSGGSIRLGFEGGQMPLLRRLPKRGFNNVNFRVQYAPVNVGALDALAKAGIQIVDEAALRKAGLINGRYDGVKLLGTGEVTQKITVRVHAASAGAKEKIQKAGGTLELKPVRSAVEKPKPASAKASKAK